MNDRNDADSRDRAAAGWPGPRAESRRKTHRQGQSEFLAHFVRFIARRRSAGNAREHDRRSSDTREPLGKAHEHVDGHHMRLVTSQAERKNFRSQGRSTRELLAQQSRARGREGGRRLRSSSAPLGARPSGRIHTDTKQQHVRHDEVHADSFEEWGHGVEPPWSPATLGSTPWSHSSATCVRERTPRRSPRPIQPTVRSHAPVSALPATGETLTGEFCLHV